MTLKVGTLYAELDLQDRGFRTGIDSAGMQLGRLAGDVGTKVPLMTNKVETGTLAMGVALGGLVENGIRRAADAIGDLVGGGIDFQKSMLNVQSIAQVDTATFQRMTSSVLDLSTKLPQSANTLAEGLYDIQSSGFAGEQGIKVLDAAAKAASAGLTDTSVSAAGLTAVLNSYGLTADDAAHISDVMFQTVNRGVISFEELSANIGKTTALASPLGVSFEEVGAALSVLTRHGIDAENATTQLNAIMSSLLQPSQEAAELAASLGLEWDAQALRAKGLAGVMSDLIEKTNGNQTAMATLLGDTRSIRGAFVLASQGGQEFANELKEFQDVAGATDQVLSVQQQGLGYQLGILGNKALAAADAFMMNLAPAATGLVSALNGLADVLAKMPPEVWAGIGLAITVSLIPAFIALAPAAVAAAVAVGSLAVAAAPFIAVAVAIGAALAGVVAAMNFAADRIDELAMNWGDMGDRVADVAERTGRSVEDVKNAIAANMHDLGLSFEDAATKAEHDFGLVGEAAKQSAEVTDQVISHAASERADFMKQSASEALRALEEGGAVISRSGPLWAAKLADGRTIFARSAEELAQIMPQRLEKAKKDATKTVEKTLAELAGELVKGQTDWQQAWDNYGEVMENDLTKNQEIAQIKGLLTGKKLAEGLNSSDPERRASAEAMKATLEDRLFALQHDVPQIAKQTGTDYADALDSTKKQVAAAAYTLKAVVAAALAAAKIDAFQSGAGVAIQFAGGMYANRGKVEIAGLSVAEAAARYTRLRSPAQAGPLSEDSRIWGMRLVTGLGDGALMATGRLRAVLSSIAGQIRDGLTGVNPLLQLSPAGGPLLAMGGAMAGGSSSSGTVINNYVTVNGAHGELEDADQVLETLQRLTYLSGGAQG